MDSQNNSSVNGIERTNLVIGLTYAIGARAEIVTRAMEKHLAEFGYHAHVIKLSQEILDSQPINPKEDPFQRMKRLMDRGNAMRQISGDYGVLALAAIQSIKELKDKKGKKISQGGKMSEQSETEAAAGGQPEEADPSGHAFIVSSLKHPQEVEELREIYSSSFFLVAINESEDQRRANLVHAKDLRGSDADEQIGRASCRERVCQYV